MTEYVMIDRELIGKVSASLHDYKDGAEWGAFDLSALMELDDILAAPQQAAEPVAWEFQHEETGLIDFVDPQQVEWGFEKNNPRWQKIGPVSRHPPAQVVQEAVPTTIYLGKGDKIVADIYADEVDGIPEWAGVGIFDPEPGKVYGIGVKGHSIDGQPIEPDKKPLVLIWSSKPESLLVVIEELQEAVARMTGKPAQQPQPEQQVCSRCKGERGRTVEEYHNDRIIEVHWIDCEHCDGAGEEPAQPEQRAARTQIPDGVTRVRNAATGEVVWEQPAPIPTGRTHELKTDPTVFDAVLSRRKTFEIRYNDRDYHTGDTLILRRTRYTGDEMLSGEPLIYVGNPLPVTVTYMMHGPAYGLAPGWVIMGIAPAQPAPSPGPTNEQFNEVLFAQHALAVAPRPEAGQPTYETEIERVIARMDSSDPDFDDCADAVALIHRLAAEIKGPDGYATWRDAAIAERVRRVNAEWVGQNGLTRPAAPDSGDVL